MSDKDNSLEGIFYRRMSRLVPKFFHQRVMDAFRWAVQKEKELASLPPE